MRCECQSWRNGSLKIVEISFRRDMVAQYGESVQVSDRVRRVLARNPGPYTYLGTGTYIIGRGEVGIIDPGPSDPQHIDAIVRATRGERITHILVTHTHLDHSSGIPQLLQHCDATTYGFGPHGCGSAVEKSAEEGADLEFEPDVTVTDGDRLEGPTWSVECVHTPGHTSNHVCFRFLEERSLFSGDHVMGWSTSVISPPDGNMREYMHSLKALLGSDDRTYWPTHGPPVQQPHSLVRAFIEHRRERERQVIELLRSGRRSIRELVPTMYVQVPSVLHSAAGRSLLATVEYLVERGEVGSDGPVLSIDSKLHLR